MTGQQLRNAILQEAIQGRLVPNVLQPGERTGTELLLLILLERQKKENKEKGKKAKKLTLSLIEEEPWELPNSWCWCTINDIVEILDSQRIPISQGVRIPGCIPYYGANGILDYVNDYIFNDTLVLLGEDGAKWGAGDPSSYIISGKSWVNNHAHVLKCHLGIMEFYLMYALNALDLQQYIKGTTVPKLNQEYMRRIRIPLPPLSIQKAIVAKIEELFPLVDEYEKAAVELNTLNELLPDKLRKSVLQEAIHGNLVPNDIPDGEVTAQELLQQILKERQARENKTKGKKAKKLALSTIDEEPWVLPDGWCWCSLGDIVMNRDSERIPLSVEVRSRQLNIQYEYYGPGGAFDKVEGYLFDKRLLLIGEDGANLLTRSKPNAFFAEGKYWVNNHVHVLDSLLPDGIILDYIALRINGMSLADYVTGTAQPKMNQEKMNSIPIPLPPLSIQHRIVKKIKEVFSVIEIMSNK